MAVLRVLALSPLNLLTTPETQSLSSMGMTGRVVFWRFVKIVSLPHKGVMEEDLDEAEAMDVAVESLEGADLDFVGVIFRALAGLVDHRIRPRHPPHPTHLPTTRRLEETEGLRYMFEM
jgi:hypothetical protein